MPPPDDASTALPPARGASAERIDALLPQTQCRRCGFDGCLPYAQALARGEAPINRCPPGGAALIGDLARLLGRPVAALDPQCGVERPLQVARIDEERCIGCTLCIQACPVDAIAGAIRLMHTVVAQDCTGCELCVAPCPMDCIAMIEVRPARAWSRADAQRARQRMHERAARLERERAENDARLAAKAEHRLAELARDEALPDAEAARRRAIVQSALERVRERRRQRECAPPPADGTSP